MEWTKDKTGKIKQIEKISVNLFDYKITKKTLKLLLNTKNWDFE